MVSTSYNRQMVTQSLNREYTTSPFVGRCAKCKGAFMVIGANNPRELGPPDGATLANIGLWGYELSAFALNAMEAPLHVAQQAK